MGRLYAGVLGPLAMAVVICRGWMGSGGADGTLGLATLYLAIYSVVGALVGQLAQATIDESVRATLEQQLSHSSGKATD
jgi:hypothetical protein